MRICVCEVWNTHLVKVGKPSTGLLLLNTANEDYGDDKTATNCSNQLKRRGGIVFVRDKVAPDRK